jgi:WD40 repeat protein
MMEKQEFGTKRENASQSALAMTVQSRACPVGKEVRWLTLLHFTILSAQTRERNTKKKQSSFSFADERQFSFATASKDQTTRIWEVVVGERLECKNVLLCRGHTASVEVVACHPTDKERLATGGWDRTIKLWNINHPSEEGAKKKRKVDVKETVGLHFLLAFFFFFFSLPSAQLSFSPESDFVN